MVLLDDAPEEVICGELHPRLDNECIKSIDHIDEHEDLAGNTWIGKSW